MFYFNIHGGYRDHAQTHVLCTGTPEMRQQSLVKVSIADIMVQSLGRSSDVKSFRLKDDESAVSLGAKSVINCEDIGYQRVDEPAAD